MRTQDNVNKNLLLYIDIPFCPQHCSFCGKSALPPEEKHCSAYAHALDREIAASAGSVDDYKINALYVGGGIPGHMMDEALGEILHQLPAGYPIAENAEITLKVHPGMVSVDTLNACRRGRVTRLSIEYITGNIAEHEALRRFLSPSAMDITRQIIGNRKLDLSFDILAGLPGQTPRTLEETIKTCIAYGAVHFNLYTFKPTQPMIEEAAQHAANPRKHLPDARELQSLVSHAETVLAAAGFIQYLPGRFALPGKECRYLIEEAAGTECLAFGLGAVSCLDGIESGTTKDLDCYLQYSDHPEKTLQFVRKAAL